MPLTCPTVLNGNPQSCGGWQCQSSSSSSEYVDTDGCACCCALKEFVADDAMKCNGAVSDCQALCSDQDPALLALSCTAFQFEGDYCAGRYCEATMDPGLGTGCHCCCHLA